jgi:hypothetical protein
MADTIESIDISQNSNQPMTVAAGRCSSSAKRRESIIHRINSNHREIVCWGEKSVDISGAAKS